MKRKFDYIVWLVTIIFVGLTFTLPETIPTHWGFTNTPDSYGSRYMFLIFALLPAFIYYLMSFSKKIDPKGENLDKNDNYQLMRELCTSIMIAVGIVIYMAIMLKGFNIQMGMCVVMGLFFIAIGNYMPRVKQNYFLGIKTPWALADERNWDATHRFGGKLYVVMGLIIIVSGFLGSWFGFAAVLICALGSTIGVFVYSYQYYKKNK